MNVKITQESRVTRPVPDPLRSSVLDHATVVDLPSFGLRNSEGLWPSYNCLSMNNEPEFCLNLNDVTPAFDTAPWTPAFEFSAQGGAECKAVGLDTADMEAEVKRVFALSEGKAVERALLNYRFEAGTQTPTPWWDAPIDLSVTGPTGTQALRIALARLEGYAAANYAGLPTIHMSRESASLLGVDLTWVDGKAFTRGGAKVACGGGYLDHGGAWDLFVTGEVYVERSDEVTVQSYKIPSSDTTVEDNTVLMMAERLYRVGVDCIVAKATATVW